MLRSLSCALPLALLLLAGETIANSWSYSRVLFEREPNNRPDQAQSFRGAAQLIGELPAGDTDHFWWVVEEEEAGQLWRITLNGETTAGITLSMSWPADDSETHATVMEFGASTPDSQAQSVQLLTLDVDHQHKQRSTHDLLIPPGDHLITLSGHGQYELLFERTGPARINRRIRASDESPHLHPARLSGYTIERPEVILTLPAGNPADGLWGLGLTGELDRDIDATLINADGTELARLRDRGLHTHWNALPLDDGARLHVRVTDAVDIGRLLVEWSAQGLRASEDRQRARSPDETRWFEPGQTILIAPLDNQREHLRFEIDQAQAKLTWHIEFDSDQDTPTTACLHRDGERSSICREAVSGRAFDSISLAPGIYELRLERNRNQPAAEIELRLLEAEPLPTRQARRPNDQRSWAAPATPGIPLEGNFSVAPRVWFTLPIDEPGRYWTVTATGEAVSLLDIYPDGNRNSMLRGQPTGSSNEIRLENLWLEPGEYQLQLSGRSGEYTLLAQPQSLPDGQWEIEPNQSLAQATPLRLGEVMYGTLHDSNDQDHFQFTLPGWNHLGLIIEPAPGQTLRAELSWGEQRLFMTQVSEDRPLDFGQPLPPGDYHLQLRGNPAPGQPYRILTELRSPARPSGPDQSGVSRVMPIHLPASGRLEMRHGVMGLGEQFVALPVADEDRTVEFEFTGPRLPMKLIDETDEELPIESGDGNQRRFQLAAGQRAWLTLTAGNSARTLTFRDPATQQSAGEPASEVSLALHRSDGPAGVAAYRAEAQSLAFRLSLSNPGDAPKTVRLRSHVSHLGATVEGLPDSVSLAPGQQREIDLELSLPPMLSSALPVILHLLADTNSAHAELAVEPGVAPLNAQVHQAVPDELLGLADLAWSALGAQFIDEQGEPVDERYADQRVNLQHLVDGMSSGGNSMHWRGNQPLPTLVLAGDGGRLRGFVFNQRSSHALHQRWHQVQIESAMLPGQWQTIASIELASHDGEQFFPLEQPVEARYLRLTPLETWGGIDQRSSNGTGMFRALGEPLGELADKRHDLLATELGGHWIYSRPADATPLDFPHLWRVPRGGGVNSTNDTIELVYGFLQHRGGFIDRLSWEEDLGHDGEPVETIRVMTATESPLGPWQDHGQWTLQRNASGQAEFRFPQTTAARYLRLVVSLPESGRNRQTWRWRGPTAIRAFEAHGLASRQSLLGYWGMDDARGPIGSPGGELAGLAVDDGDSRPAQPRLLEARVRGQLAQPGDRRSYHIDLADPDNRLRLGLRESQQGRLQTMLHGPDGALIDLDWQPGEDGWQQAKALPLVPGRYRLDVVEPPRSIVFAWDGSGSISAMQPAIYQALNRFAQGLIPGQEAVNLLPLGGPLLIDGWAEQPREISRVLAAYDGRFQSSDSEPALITASRALQQRDGERIIFLLTDAELIGRDLSVWNSLERAQPRVIALEISHGSPRDTTETRGYQNLMKSWAHAAAGEYFYTVDRATLIQSFEAAMDRIRQPSQFELVVERDYAEPPQPGQLRVVSGDRPVVSGGAIHLIFDASGSMLRRMEGGRRIDVARRIVRDVLERNIPDEVPVALRAFGHTEPHSCETELLVEARNDNRDGVLAAVEGIQAINLARTPLAASLDAVPGDLRGFDQERQLVVMFTDGEETCDGDVEASVMALVESGVNVRLNIVGFHIDEIGLQSDFERFAALGGGEYFDTRDSAGLTSSLIEALAAPFRVYDRHDQSVARGRVDGEPITLEPGNYRVVIEASDGDREFELELAPAAVHELRLDTP